MNTICSAKQKDKINSTKQLIQDYVKTLSFLLKQIDCNQVSTICQWLTVLKQQKKTLYICGNGGSAANAIHIANDLTFGISPEGDAIKVEALSANSSILTCLGNDIGYEKIFSHQLKVKGTKGDILLALSGSGNSQNVILAIRQAKKLKMKTIAVLGFDGGIAKTIADCSVHFDINDMQISEDAQIILGHILMKSLYKTINSFDV